MLLPVRLRIGIVAALLLTACGNASPATAPPVEPMPTFPVTPTPAESTLTLRPTGIDPSPNPRTASSTTAPTASATPLLISWQDSPVVPVVSEQAREIYRRGYEIPLWNFWAAVQSLPGYGLQEDGVHLTWAGNRFDDPEAMSRGWPIRNLTALQALDAVRKGIAEQK